MENSRIVKTDWVIITRAISTCAVILLHVVAPIANNFGKIPEDSWWLGNIINSLTRFCVPSFLMITGYLLLPKVSSLGEFLKKRLIRVLLPFFFWSLAYLAYFTWSHWNKGDVAGSSEWISFFSDKLKFGTAFHLWYIYMLVGIYLIIPILSRWVIQATRKELQYFLIFWIVLLFFDMKSLNLWFPYFDLRYFSGYIGYPVLGFYIGTSEKHRERLWHGVFMFITGVLITALATSYFSHTNGSWHPEFNAYLSPNVVLASAGMFLIFRNMNFTILRGRKFVDSISERSYGIYLAHISVMIMLSYLGIDWAFIHPSLGIPLTTLLCLFGGWAITAILSKLPWGKYISG